MDAPPSLFLRETVAPPFPFIPTATSGSARLDGHEVQASARGLSPRALARALDYIERHIGDTITLADIASAACISRFHFARLFRVSTGRSPMEFVLAKRIALAQEQLARGPQKISATAASLGFFDQSHFTRTFRRMTGYSPREFCHLHAPVTRSA
ncbi:helix-turn-helix transcriptional regulator [Pseudoxanthomonas mexicana]|uniref:helix-turn-helix transcriptional regulator n=1 Tax=Pseudoxanthomonas mexicana TaxID=128785 RepID=UPI0028981A31|nr:AraC family transcriptional regulator [Pseudoxanthomonas mexicana]MCA0299188.1 AraC family transcriptional regulator [Pseudomonadota bacterium]HMM24615.1 AraC family transcriptional regulator [Pseudoxanthomonas mexicana]